MRKAILATLLFTASGLIALPEVAQAQEPGGYQGVVPGNGNNLPRVAEIKSKSGTWVTWPGFISLPDGGSRIFLQTTGAISYKRADEKSKIVITIDNASVFLNNNRNSLETSHFNTPVNRVYLKSQKKKKLLLIIELRAQAEALVSQSIDPDGFSYLFVDFPAGQYPATQHFSAAQ